jgi:hypothetical protein
LFNGNLTVKDGSGNTLVIIGKEEISPRFKVASFWPIPSSTAVYMEYYKKIKELNHDYEMPEFDPKWHHVVRIGTLAKIYEYLGKENEKITTNAWYSKMVRAMVADDEIHPDYVSQIERRSINPPTGIKLYVDENVTI